MNRQWNVRLASRAEQDFFDIVQWKAASFGPAQAKTYAKTLSMAVGAMTEGPDIPGVRQRDDIAPGVCTLHVARLGRKGRHLVLFRVGGEQVIDVLRLLHDRMDLAKHIPGADESGAH